MRPARRFSCTTSPRSTRGVAALVSCLGFHPFQARTFLSVGLGSAAICRKYLALSCGMPSVSATWVTSSGALTHGSYGFPAAAASWSGACCRSAMSSSMCPSVSARMVCQSSNFGEFPGCSSTRFPVKSIRQWPSLAGRVARSFSRSSWPATAARRGSVRGNRWAMAMRMTRYWSMTEETS